MCAFLVDLPMHDFDIILCMDWSHSCYAYMDCRSRVVRFHFCNEEELIWEGYNLSRPNPLILHHKATKMMTNELLCVLASVNDLDHDVPSIYSVIVVNELTDVFGDDFPRVPPREIGFAIDLELDIKPISIPP